MQQNVTKISEVHEEHTNYFMKRILDLEQRCATFLSAEPDIFIVLTIGFTLYIVQCDQIQYTCSITSLRYSAVKRT